jgi:NAD(P)-dependent dehydrogenase (short-subunit alcohol dehydrogenase family)
MTATTGKSALIIGASRGLGCALAAEYLARGWQVAATVRGSARTGLDKSPDGRLVVETGRPRRAPDDRPVHPRRGRHDRGPGRQRRTAVPGLPGPDGPLVRPAVRPGRPELKGTSR